MNTLIKRFLVMEENKENGGGGGGAPDHAKELADLKAANAKLIQDMEALKNPTKDDTELINKAKKDREDSDNKSNDAKALEAALRFNIGAADWIKTNQSLLPKEISDIFQTAEKETYANAIEKDRAIKSGVIQSFFSVQSNLDLLTATQKNNLEEYLKLTKNGKEEKAQSLYDSIFEPAFEMLKRVKKAEAISKGLHSGSDAEDSYKNKMIALSRKHYLGEK